MNYCTLCGHLIPKRRWWQFPTSVCRDKDQAACQRRFVEAFMYGRVVPPASPTGRWLPPETGDDDANP